jgi:hypothetical protein
LSATGKAAIITIFFFYPPFFQSISSYTFLFTVSILLLPSLVRSSSSSSSSSSSIIFFLCNPTMFYWFEFREGQEFSLLDIVQTDSGAHTASYPVGKGGKAARA